MSLAAVLLMSITSGAAFAGNGVPDNVVGGDANGKDGYKTGVHINNAGAATGLAVGLTHHWENGVSGKVAVAADPTNFSNSVVAGASVGYSW